MLPPAPRQPSSLEPGYPSEEEGKADLCATETHSQGTGSGRMVWFRPGLCMGNISCVSLGKRLTLSELRSKDSNTSFCLWGF